MISIFDRMIDHDTGALDMLVIEEAAKVRAAREYGSPNFPPRYLREADEWCMDRAKSMRRVWRQHHGLPSEEAGVPMQMPSWGASGDSFRR